jgi:hypothetical protein
MVFALAFALVASVPLPADARCAQLSLADEIARSRYVFEGVVESSSGGRTTLRVTASWKGNPPARVTVTRSGRGDPFAGATASRVYIVFTGGASDARLSAHRCGATGDVSGVPASALEAAGLHRTPR